MPSPQNARTPLPAPENWSVDVKRLAVSLSLLCASSAVLAVEAACEPIVAATEKTSAQPARHTTVELGDGQRGESILADGQVYIRMGERWMKAPASVPEAERKLNADLRNGTIKTWDCKRVGTEAVDAVPTTVYSYRQEIPGLPKVDGPIRVYIGRDGLVYAIESGGTRSRIRYTGVTAPKF